MKISEPIFRRRRQKTHDGMHSPRYKRFSIIEERSFMTIAINLWINP